jgi:hypothetical protein
MILRIPTTRTSIVNPPTTYHWTLFLLLLPNTIPPLHWLLLIAQTITNHLLLSLIKQVVWRGRLRPSIRHTTLRKSGRHLVTVVLVLQVIRRTLLVQVVRRIYWMRNRRLVDTEIWIVLWGCCVLLMIVTNSYFILSLRRVSSLWPIIFRIGFHFFISMMMLSLRISVKILLIHLISAVICEFYGSCRIKHGRRNVIDLDIYDLCVRT